MPNIPSSRLALLLSLLELASLRAADAPGLADPAPHLHATATDSPCEHLSLDAQWKFRIGNDLGSEFGRLKGGDGSPDAAQPGFNDQAWRTINLPHDWAIEFRFNQTANRNGRGVFNTVTSSNRPCFALRAGYSW